MSKKYNNLALELMYLGVFIFIVGLIVFFTFFNWDYIGYSPLDYCKDNGYEYIEHMFSAYSCYNLTNEFPPNKIQTKLFYWDEIKDYVKSKED